MAGRHTLEIALPGLDCAEDAQEVQRAAGALPGVRRVDVLLSARKAVVTFDPAVVDPRAIHEAIEQGTGCCGTEPSPPAARPGPLGGFTRQVLTVFGLVFGGVLVVVVLGEWLGLFEAVSRRMPWPLGLALVLAGGYPVFWSVARATRRGRVTSHTLMTLGTLAAL
ncbi:MAG: cation transporter, partial [Armatimonadota bacterium]|nr:cation transporter [Armatimonadota bacterium]